MTAQATPDDRSEFRDRLKDIRAGMLEAQGSFLPMSHNLEPEDGRIWFLTARGTDIAAAAAEGAKTRYIVASDAQGLHAEIQGRLAVSQSREKLDQVWSAMAAQWFEQGKEDPDLVLVELTPVQAEVWLGPENGLQFLMELAKAKLTGKQPDYGRRFTLSF